MKHTLVIPKDLEKKPYELNRFYVQRILEFNIVTLNLPPGQLVSTKELAQELQISKTPVHDACIELSKKSLTTIIPQVGTKIAHIDVEKVKAVSFLRFSAEIKMLETACEMLREPEILSLYRCIEKQEMAINEKDYLGFLEQDNAFHSLLFKGAGLTEVCLLIEPYMPIFNQVRILIYKNLDIPRIVQEHTDLVKCLEKRDLAGATEVLSRHLSHDVTRDLEILKRIFPQYFLPPGQLLY
ncbi:MAG: GntR family transcriptional regulator [Sphaerochaetaceae bacterium]